MFKYLSKLLFKYQSKLNGQFFLTEFTHTCSDHMKCISIQQNVLTDIACFHGRHSSWPASASEAITIRDCSLFIGSTGPVFRGTGQGLFLMLPSTGHKDFLCFYGNGT